MDGRIGKCRQNFGWKREGKRLLGKPRRKWEDNTRTDIRQIV